MPTNEENRSKTAENPPDADLRIEGIVKLEAADTQPADLTLRAYVFDQGGRLLGEGNLDEKGGTIHKNYNGWVQNLDKAIRAQLQML